jgi:hypothetical protein
MNKKPTIWIFSIEPLETRYTAQWHTHIPNLLENNIGDKYNIVQIDGIQNNTETTPGAFLNFSDTNYWKSTQLCKWLDYYNSGKVSKDDQLLFTDAWNPVILQIKYMKDLLGNDWKLHGLWHAGAYDPYDFLGRAIGNAEWVMNTEKAMYYAYDHNYFATDFHIDLFAKTHSETFDNEWVVEQTDKKKIVRTGWPMEYLTNTLSTYKNLPKRNLILFPHRIAPEKQVEIFRDLATSMPQYEFVVCQDQKLSKHEYHKLLGESKMVFSASNQETLGISTGSEGPILGSVPLCPNRLSYREMYDQYPEFLYPSEWTLNWGSYTKNKVQLIDKISHIINNSEQYNTSMEKYIQNHYTKYFHANELVSILRQL